MPTHLSRTTSTRWFRLHLVLTGILIAAMACVKDGTAPVTGGPPPPPPPPPVVRTIDLRFKGVGLLASTYDAVHSDVDRGLQLFFDSAAGTPFELGPGTCSAIDCAWQFDVFALPENVAPVSAMYTAAALANLPVYLDTAATDTIIQTLDLEPGPGLVGVARLITSRAGGYHLAAHLVPLAGLQAAATQEGAENRVITALSFDSGQVLYVSYAWDHDSAPAGYDARVATATPITTADSADTLAAAGYVITAMGGDSADGFVLVGTKLHGATTPRSLIATFPTDSSGYAPVAYFLTGSGAATILFEK